jgi:hypothetical protein
MTSLDTSDPRDSAYGRDYWLHRCEGFRVEAAGRGVGTVHGLRFRGSIEPDLLEVRTGLFGRRVVLISVEQVEELLPQKRRIVLRASFTDRRALRSLRERKSSRPSERR